jgi:hypothetical protein
LNILNILFSCKIEKEKEQGSKYIA